MNHNVIRCQFCRCACPIDASNPHAGALLNGKPVCPRCIAGEVINQLKGGV